MQKTWNMQKAQKHKYLETHSWESLKYNWHVWTKDSIVNYIYIWQKLGSIILSQDNSHCKDKKKKGNEVITNEFANSWTLLTDKTDSFWAITYTWKI